MSGTGASGPPATGDRAVLLTGATGYVGGRLRVALEDRGVPLTCLARRPETLRPHVGEGTSVVAGDVLDPATLAPALAGIHTAYYLVHSLGAAGDFEERERTGARNFAAAARDAGVRRIVYLGGLGVPGDDLSAHLRSRHETGRVLRSAGVPVVELRASIVIGSGSVSFEMIRALVERLPVMICPRWVETPAQPIAIEDLVAYLVAALDLPDETDRVIEIGGADRATYGDVMREYARQRGLIRWLVPVPLLTPRVSSLWLGLVTPVYARVGRKLIDGLRNPSVVRDPVARDLFPIRPRGLRDALARALANEEREFAVTRWSDAFSSAGSPPSGETERSGTRLIDARVRRVSVPADRAFAPIARIGGRTGWYYADPMWRVRGLLDLLAGGPGLRRGRRDPVRPRVGDTVDFWRVEAYEPGRRLRLRAEMRLPGRAWLELEARPEADGGATLHQTAVFDAHGLGGLAYWYLLWPVHRAIFRGMLAGIARAAEAGDGAPGAAA